MGDGRAPTVRDIARIVKVTDPHFSPDGKMLALGNVMPVNTHWIDADIDARGNIAFIGQTRSDPYELYLTPADGGAPVAITRVNAGLSDLALARSETVTWKGPGGRTPRVRARARM